MSDSEKSLRLHGKCQSCGVPFSLHPGLVPTCAALQKFKPVPQSSVAEADNGWHINHKLLRSLSEKLLKKEGRNVSEISIEYLILDLEKRGYLKIDHGV